MTKRKTKKKNSQRKKTNKKNFNLISVLLIIIAILSLISIFLYTYEKKELNVENKVKFEEYTDSFYEEYVDKETIEKLKKQIENINQDIDLKQNLLLKPKPKLAIVMDDITTKNHLNKIKELEFKVSPALLPPTNRHPNSGKIAKNEEFYMIHFPLQAMSFASEETNTLHIDDSYETIEKRVRQLRELYPNAKYTNNHTGSKFTANKDAMEKLFKALKKHDFIFVDSRTTGKSVAKQMTKKFDMPYISRNVFLDNELNFDYIQNQLKKAIKIAKKNGYAIAICHPHSITFKVLKESKILMEDLELIYLDQLPFL